MKRKLSKSTPKILGKSTSSKGPKKSKALKETTISSRSTRSNPNLVPSVEKFSRSKRSKKSLIPLETLNSPTFDQWFSSFLKEKLYPISSLETKKIINEFEQHARKNNLIARYKIARKYHDIACHYQLQNQIDEANKYLSKAYDYFTIVAQTENSLQELALSNLGYLLISGCGIEKNISQGVTLLIQIWNKYWNFAETCTYTGFTRNELFNLSGSGTSIACAKQQLVKLSESTLDIDLFERSLVSIPDHLHSSTIEKFSHRFFNHISDSLINTNLPQGLRENIWNILQLGINYDFLSKQVKVKNLIVKGY